MIEKDDENLKACESFHNKVFNVVGPVCESADFLAKVLKLVTIMMGAPDFTEHS